MPNQEQPTQEYECHIVRTTSDYPTYTPVADAPPLPTSESFWDLLRRNFEERQKQHQETMNTVTLERHMRDITVKPLRSATVIKVGGRFHILANHGSDNEGHPILRRVGSIKAAKESAFSRTINDTRINAFCARHGLRATSHLEGKQPALQAI